jgi:hypothetical protein
VTLLLSNNLIEPQLIVERNVSRHWLWTKKEAPIALEQKIEPSLAVKMIK